MSKKMIKIAVAVLMGNVSTFLLYTHLPVHGHTTVSLSTTTAPTGEPLPVEESTTSTTLVESTTTTTAPAHVVHTTTTTMHAVPTTIGTALVVQRPTTTTPSTVGTPVVDAPPTTIYVVKTRCGEEAEFDSNGRPTLPGTATFTVQRDANQKVIVVVTNESGKIAEIPTKTLRVHPVEGQPMDWEIVPSHTDICPGEERIGLRLGQYPSDTTFEIL